MRRNYYVLKKNYQRATGKTIVGTHTELGIFYLPTSESRSVLVRAKKLFEDIMVDIFQNLMKTVNLQSQELNKPPY